MLDLAALRQCPFCQGDLVRGWIPGGTVWFEKVTHWVLLEHARYLGGKPGMKSFRLYLSETALPHLHALRCPACGVVICEDRSGTA